MADVETTISTAVADLLPTLLAVGAVGITIGASVFALRKGWNIVRSFAK